MKKQDKKTAKNLPKPGCFSPRDASNRHCFGKERPSTPLFTRGITDKFQFFGRLYALIVEKFRTKIQPGCLLLNQFSFKLKICGEKNSNLKTIFCPMRNIYSRKIYSFSTFKQLSTHFKEKISIDYHKLQLVSLGFLFCT